MRMLRSAAVAVVAATALVAPTVSADAAPSTSRRAAQPSAQPSTQPSATQSAQASARPSARASLRLKAVRGYQHYLQVPDKLVAKAKGLSGKVTFVVDGKAIAKKRLKHGKAKATVPGDLAVGVHKIKVKSLSRKKVGDSLKFTVYSGGVTPNGASYTYSQSAYPNPFTLAGSVTWKGQPGSGGYVDLYKAPYTFGSDSPDLMCFASVSGGAFSFNGYCSGFEDPALVGQTLTLRLYYTQDADFVDYVSGAPITVTIVP
jgi:hypothetical protein